MLMDRNSLLHGFTRTRIPSYCCPHCVEGRLKLEGAFISEETKASMKDQGEDYWDVDFVVLRFNCKLKCPACSEIVFFIGSGGVDEEHDVDEHGGWSTTHVNYYSPKFFYPPIIFIRCPDKTPYLVKEQVVAASSLYFAHPDSCCNSIRAAAEEILTDLGIPALNENGAYASFVSRIKQLPPEKESVKALFDAIRWLGNHGSHPGTGLLHTHSLDAFEILELLLEEVYSDSKLKIQELAKRINEAKGPVGRHSRLALGE